MAMSLIISEDLHLWLICDHADIQSCYPVGINDVRIADRLSG